MRRIGGTGQPTRFKTRTRTAYPALVSALALVAGLLYGAALPSEAQAASSTAATVTPVVPAAAQTVTTVTLITGDRVAVTSAHGGTTAQLVPSADSGPAETYRTPGGDEYVVPAVAAPYLGRQLDSSLFDVSALLRDGFTTGAHIPVSVAYAAGVTPSAPPGVTLTSVSGQSASGYLTSASTASFAAGLRAAIGADVRSGQPAGSGALFGGVTGVYLAGGLTIGAVSPHYVMHDVQIDETDLSGNPLASGEVLFNDLDDLEAGYGNVPVDDGVGRVALPAGHYLASSLFFDFDDSGNLSAIRLITDDEVTVPTSGTAPDVKLSEADATSAITVRTPRPATQQLLNIMTYDSDVAGDIGGTGIIGISDTPTYVNAVAKPPVGWVRLQITWSGVGPAPGPAYRYDVAFSETGVPADEAYVVRPSQIATVKQSYYADPAEGTNGILFNTVYDQTVNALMANGGFLVTGGAAQTMPSTVTDYLGTADTGEWGQSIFTPNYTSIQADLRTFTGGENTTISWLHGPLAPSIGQHTGQQFCDACTAGASLDLGFVPIGDSAPDHSGWFPGETDDFAFYRDGVLVYDGSAEGIDAAGLNTAPATYRAVYTRDASGDSGVSQSAYAVTDLTVDSATGVALPSEDSCYGQSATTPCRLLPALTLDYQLDTDLTNTSDKPIELLRLGVSHVAYDGAESHAAITSAAVSVSFDGGTTWQKAVMTGSRGRYIAAWVNPASAKGTSPELKVGATDAVGGRITQTIVDAYTIAK